MLEMSRYSTSSAYRALVAGPLKNGEVVASWRNTSRNAFSAGLRIAMFVHSSFGGIAGRRGRALERPAIIQQPAMPDPLSGAITSTGAPARPAAAAAQR